MTLSFNIEYRTQWGEEVCIDGLLPQPLPLHTSDGIRWTVETQLDVPSAGSVVFYRYQIRRAGAVVRTEWDNFPRCLALFGTVRKKYILCDCWRDIPSQAYLYSSAFTEALLARQDKDGLPASGRKSLVIKVYAPAVRKNQYIALCGNQKALGNWEPADAIAMSDAHFPEWQVELDVSKLKFPLEYKFILCSRDQQQPVVWENNPNRPLADPHLSAGETLVISDRHACFNVPAWKGAGVAIPVFSLRSEQSFGVGDFGDLKLMVDWAVLTRQQMIQVLPINDTTMTHTWIDSYPYSGISIYAFHPMYADIRQMGQLADREAADRLESRRKELNALPTVDYEAVNRVKWEYYRLLFQQDGEQTLSSEGFRKFYATNKEWLQPYAAFCYLRDAYRTPDFRLWPKYATYRAEEIEEMCQPGTAHYPHIAIHLYLQYHLHLQLLAATQYARSKGVCLKGDIPIGISRNSVEAWTEPYYFNLDGQAGAPPDDFAVQGQNWGFPTYKWEVMERDGYRWWMQRFQKMAAYFDAYRIDHILGFFRIWEIPMHAVHGLLGQFVPSLPMTRQEIESYGFHFRGEYLSPCIQDAFLGQLFGPHTDEVKRDFLLPAETPGTYRMKPEFDTQRAVERHFDGCTDADSISVRDGLYALISNVLFVADKKDPQKYHPRIGVQHDFVFHTLPEEDRNAFNRLYEQYFYHRHNDFWQQQAMRKLPRLTQSTRMLVCGEDLGMIPACVAPVMRDLRILSLEIQRMPKNPLHEFGHPDEYPYASVCTISTHDMSTLRGWWEEDSRQTQRYYNTMLGHYGTAPAVATPELCEEVIRCHLKSNSILCIPSLQDWLSLDGKWRNPDVKEERINVPANPRNYWHYRMHLTLEQLLAADALNEKLRCLIEETGRI